MTWFHADFFGTEGSDLCADLSANYLLWQRLAQLYTEDLVWQWGTEYWVFNSVKISNGLTITALVWPAFLTIISWLTPFDTFSPIELVSAL